MVVADVHDDDESANVPDAPVVDGAAGNNQGQREITGTTPAARAAIVTHNDKAKPTEETDIAEEVAPPKNKAKRRLIALLVVLVALAGLFFASRSYIKSQYFVGVQGNNVVIYQGVNGAVGPIKLYSLQEKTDVMVNDLN